MCAFDVNNSFANRDHIPLTNESVCYPMIRAMHETMTRLYLAAKTLKKKTKPADVARLLNVSSQTIANWEDRGMSADGIITAQEQIGCNAVWLRDGKGSMTLVGMETASNESPIDLNELKDAIEAAVEIDKGAKLDLPPDKLALVVAFWYDEWTSRGRYQPTANDVRRILRLVA